MKWALISAADQHSAAFQQLGPHNFVRELFIDEPVLHDGLTIQQVEDDVRENWIDDGAGGFMEPPVIEPPLEATPFIPGPIFISLLNDDEYTNLMVASEDLLREKKPDATLSRFLEMLRLQGVRLDDDLTKAAKTAMVKYKILSQKRAEEVFNPNSRKGK